MTGQRIGRRAILKGAAAAGAAWMMRPLLGRARAQTALASISAKPMDRVSTDPSDAIWSVTPMTRVPMNPQNLVLPRLSEAGAKEINVRAQYDAELISFRVEWPDAHRDEDLGTVLQYRDAVAIQFPEDPAAGPTSFMMGQSDRAVTIYHWKSDWQFGQFHDVDEAYPNMYADWYQYSGREAGEIPEASDYMTKGDKTYLTAAAAGNPLADPQAQQTIGPIQKMRATGFGTLEPDAVQDAQGFAAWHNGTWRVVFTLPRGQPKFSFDEGMTVPVAFAVWDGSRNERNGQKAYSNWQNMLLAAPVEAVTPTPVPPTPEEERERGGIVPPVLGGVGGAVAAAVAALIGLRMREQRRQRERRQ
ncbi:MAG: ethylbenzene dehydrogenase-related protein [Chloroflexi bacterium]|nr:ethylbenzene dehydrogenase-related protein [Chloroflexota bacterium]